MALTKCPACGTSAYSARRLCPTCRTPLLIAVKNRTPSWPQLLIAAVAAAVLAWLAASWLRDHTDWLAPDAATGDSEGFNAGGESADCEKDAQFAKAIAVDRDSGTTKEEADAKAGKNHENTTATEALAIVDAIYLQPKLSPEAAYRNFGMTCELLNAHSGRK